MGGREGLAQGAGVVGLHVLVGHLLDAFVARLVFGPGRLGQLVHVFLLGVEGHLDLVQDLAEVLVELGVQHDTDVFQGKALFHGGLADADPGDVALADVHDALDVVDQMVDLALQDGLEVGLHLAAGHLHENAHGEGVAFLQVVDVRAVHDDLAVLDLVHLGHLDQLGALGLAAAALGVQVGAAHPLALVSRAEGAGDLDVGDGGLQAAHLHALWHISLVGHVGHHVLVGADTRGQDLGDVGVGQGRETPVDAAGCRHGPLGADVAQGVDEGEDAVLVVHAGSSCSRRA